MAIHALTLRTGSDYVRPTTPIATNEDYLAFVLSETLIAAQNSYQVQHGAETPDDGVTAAREAFNASLDPPAEAPEEGGGA